MNRDIIQEFDPVLFSQEENTWLLGVLGKPATVALREIAPGVNPNAVRPMLMRFQELEDIAKHEGIPWAGYEAIKESIKVFMREDAKWENDARRSRKAPRFPSLYSFDSKGKAHLGGPGSDSGRVRTYFGPNGQRIPFAVTLVPEQAFEWRAPTGGTETPTDGLTVNADLNRIECFCGHTEQFKEGSRASYNAARARISKHLRRATEQVDRHREIHTNEFTS